MASQKFSVLFAGSFALVTIVLAVCGTIGKISYKEAVICLVAMLGISALAGGGHGVRLAFLGWICTLAIGYRTFEVSPHLRIHPSELLLWGLLALLVAMPKRRREHREGPRLPLWLWLFLPFWLWGWFVGQEAGRPWDLMLSELRNFLLLLLLFPVAAAMLRERKDWQSALLAFFATGTWVAAWGLAEYLFPEVRRVLPGFISNSEAVATPEGFARARFSFWGTQAATYICALAAPMAIPIWRWWPAPWARTFTLLAVLLQVGGVYVGGFRILWVLLAVQFLLFFCLGRSYVLGALIVLVCLAGNQAFPDPAGKRMESFVTALSATPIDTSSAKHLSRASEALAAAMENPLGMGWSGAGWVHCDFLQIAANLGLLAGLLYSGAYLTRLSLLLRQVFGRPLSPEHRDLLVALVLSFITAGGLLATQAVSVLPQLVLPVWFVWVLTEIALRQSDAKKRSVRLAASNLRTFAHLQLRNYASRYPRVRQVGG